MFTQTILRQSRSAAAAAGAVRALSTTSARSFARMQIIGRITTPEAVNTSTGKELIRYSICSNTGHSEHKKASWFRVASFTEGKSRDFLMSLPQGTLLNLAADATMGSYTDAKGESRQALTLVQRDIHIISRPRKSEGEETVSHQAAIAAA